MEPSGFGVVVDRLFDLTHSQSVEGTLVEVELLTLIDAGEVVDDLLTGADDAVEQATRVNRWELLRVPHKDELAVAPVDLLD